MSQHHAGRYSRLFEILRASASSTIKGLTSFADQREHMHRVISPPNLDQRSMGDRIQHSGITFTAADMPNANRLTVGIMAMAAEEERRAVCERTRAALAAARRGGVRLGGPVENLKNAELGRQKAAEAREANRHPAPPTSCR